MTHVHTGRCGDLHKFEGQPWADAALDNYGSVPVRITTNTGLSTTLEVDRDAVLPGLWDAEMRAWLGIREVKVG